ncbi:unnamed protein product [marine sediment metagenome]|uniref:Uncharacterized protein n=1 Tax=marine sediment metagenome TaxID=412755 RepID=X1EDC5_9ZZZZ
MKKHIFWILFSVFIVINIGLINVIYPSFMIHNVDIDSQQQGRDGITAVNEKNIP